MDFYLHLRLLGGRVVMSKSHSSFSSHVSRYITGLVACLIVTLISFFVVVQGGRASFGIIALLILLAGVQVALQSYFFLHIGQEEKPRWQTIAYAFAAMMVSMIVLGSLWVMSHLNYNMMRDMKHKEQEIIKDERVHETQTHQH